MVNVTSYFLPFASFRNHQFTLVFAIRFTLGYVAFRLNEDHDFPWTPIQTSVLHGFLTCRFAARLTLNWTLSSNIQHHVCRSNGTPCSVHYTHSYKLTENRNSWHMLYANGGPCMHAHAVLGSHDFYDIKYGKCKQSNLKGHDIGMCTFFGWFYAWHMWYYWGWPSILQNCLVIDWSVVNERGTYTAVSGTCGPILSTPKKNIVEGNTKSPFMTTILCKIIGERERRLLMSTTSEIQLSNSYDKREENKIVPAVMLGGRPTRLATGLASSRLDMKNKFQTCRTT